MVEFLRTPAARFVLMLAVLAVVVVAGVYVVSLVRRRLLAGQPGASALLTKFRELHAKGELSDEEFRTIKSTLASRLEAELNENGKEV